MEGVRRQTGPLKLRVYERGFGGFIRFRCVREVGQMKLVDPNKRKLFQIEKSKQ